MKALMIASVLLSTTLSAQTLDLASLKNLMLERKATLELVTPGMSKRLTTLSSIELENGERCNFKQVSDQSVLKVMADKVLVYSLQKFMPANSPACLNNGFKPFAEKILFYDEKPEVLSEVEELESVSSQITSIKRTGNQVSIVTSDEEGQTTFTYDMGKPLFRNLISTQGPDLNITSTELADVIPSRIDLTSVLFCEMEEGEVSDCVEGDYSDFLFD